MARSRVEPARPVILTASQIHDLRTAEKELDFHWVKTLIDRASEEGPNLVSRIEIAKVTTPVTGVMRLNVRCSILRPDNFSVGLFVLSGPTTYRLMRCDGPTGTHVNLLPPQRRITNCPHIHFLTECYQRRFGIERGDGHAIPTTLYYDDWRDAVRVLAEKAHIQLQGELL